MVRDVVHPEAEIVFDSSKPDGTPRKLLDVSRLHELGWRHKVELRDGIVSAYAWFLANHDEARGVSAPAELVRPVFARKAPTVSSAR